MRNDTQFTNIVKSMLCGLLQWYKVSENWGFANVLWVGAIICLNIVWNSDNISRWLKRVPKNGPWGVSWITRNSILSPQNTDKIKKPLNILNIYTYYTQHNLIPSIYINITHYKDNKYIYNAHLINPLINLHSITD